MMMMMVILDPLPIFLILGSISTDRSTQMDGQRFCQCLSATAAAAATTSLIFHFSPLACCCVRVELDILHIISLVV